MQPRRDLLCPLKLMTVLNPVLLSVRAWTGGAVNLFASFPPGTVNCLAQLFPALLSADPGPLAVWHGLEAFLIVLLSVAIAVSASRRTKSRSVSIAVPLALLSVLSAGVCGYLFALSGFFDDPYSAQMGGPFIGAYAMDSVGLHCSKQSHWSPMISRERMKQGMIRRPQAERPRRPAVA